MLEPFDCDCDPEEYADFEHLEDRLELMDLELADTPCPECWGEIKAWGAFGLRVIVVCGRCSKLWSLELEGIEDPLDYDDEDEDEDN